VDQLDAHDALRGVLPLLRADAEQLEDEDSDREANRGDESDNDTDEDLL
jgi:hypothetical protein